MINKATNKLITMAIIIGFIFTLMIIGCSEDENSPKEKITPNDITWTATANDTKNTTAIDFTFSASASGLTANNISITNETGFLTTGALTGSGTSWSLAVNIVSGGDVSVSINKSGIESGSKTVEVFKTLPAELVGRWHLGSNEAAPFMYEFLENGDFITMAGFSGLEITADKNKITILSNGDTVGTATFSIKGNEMTLSNITGTAGLVPGVHYRRDITYNITIDNTTYTTAIYFEFNHSISGLTADHIMITNSTGSATRGELTGEGTSWTVTVTVATAGDIWVWINKPGVDINPKMMEVDNIIRWSVNTNNDKYTTAINFEFSYPVTWLTTDQIKITNGTASVTKRALIGEGTMWLQVIDVKKVGEGDISVSFTGPEFDKKIEAVVVSKNIMVSVGSTHTVVIKFDGTLWAWGDNYDGQLGDGTTQNRNTPIQVGTETDWVSISARDDPGYGYSHTIAVKTDGSLWAWGNNDVGQLGDGTTQNRNTPIQVGTETDWVFVYTGSRITFATKTDGSLWGWGDNWWGQLGDGTSGNNRYTPVKVRIATADWLSIFTGRYHTTAIKADGSRWAWGDNRQNEFAGGTLIGHNTPIQIGTESDWVAVSVSNGGNGHTIAVKTDGSLWGWGWSESGQLGIGAINHRVVAPIKIGTETNWSSVYAHSEYSLAVRTDGTLWGCGSFGDVISTENITTFTQITSGTDWVAVSGGRNFIMAIKSDGSLWAWGLNDNGQLGDGTTVDCATPVQIMP